jgi:uncharacterized oligopeptide transporter (OPT) family protein
MLLGALLSLCNIYSGLKVGFTTNMSIASALLGFGFFWTAARVSSSSALGLQENAVNQTAASAAASIAGAGLVAPIPALTILTGHALSWPWLATWTLAVSCLGIFVGLGLRRQMILVDQLPFPYGMATAETLKDMYAKGREALRRALVLMLSLLGAVVFKSGVELARLPLMQLPGKVGLSASLPGAAKTASLKNLGFALEPSVLMVGVGGLIGMRASASMLGGALFSWAVLAPYILEAGWVSVADQDPDGVWFTPLANWMLWPGVALMVSSALTSFAMSAGGAWRAFRRTETVEVNPSGAVSRRFYWVGLSLAAGAAVVLQLKLFEIALFPAVAAVVLSFALAVVAGRVTGETGIAPIGAMGKVTQLCFAAISPKNPIDNLMSANVTGGAASQCSDMLHDLKAGHLVGAFPRHQAIAQLFGVLSGALAGSATYLLLVPDPAKQLITEEWPAPAVAQWKAVAEVFTQGVAHMPAGSVAAAGLAALGGVLFAVLEKSLPPSHRRWVPSAASIGLSFVLPAYYSISVFLGALLVALFARYRPGLSERFAMVVAAGLIAGEGLAGVGFAIQRMLS